MWGVHGENMGRCDRFGFSGWAVYPRCALNTATCLLYTSDAADE